LEAWKGFVSSTAIFVSLIKGIENSTRMRISEVIADVFKCSENRVAVVSGPNLAGEIIHRQPTATTIACTDEDVAADVANAMATNYFRAFWTTDVVGTELAGAIKNVVAIANGIAVGLGLGENTQSALITRGLAEMTRLGVALGAKTETFLGLAGIGDLIATSQSPLSRNRTFGEALGHGATLDEAQLKAHGTVEGAKSLAPLLAIAAKYDLDMPIAAQVLRVIRDGDDAHDVMSALLDQPITAEHE
jgi:glycerol-3-phosphate dehydrogenase (NAD(P)+)